MSRKGSSSRSATNWVSLRAASRETWSGSRSSSSRAAARPALGAARSRAERSRAERATSSRSPIPAELESGTAARKSGGRLRLCPSSLVAAMVRLPDGDERARLQDLDEANTQGEKQEPLRLPDHRPADADQDQSEDRQAEALKPVQHVDSLPKQGAAAITPAAKTTPHEHQAKGDYGNGDRTRPERIELRKRGHEIHLLQVHMNVERPLLRHAPSL